MAKRSVTLSFNVIFTHSTDCWMAARHVSPDEMLSRIHDHIQYLNETTDADVGGILECVMPWTRDQDEFTAAMLAAGNNPENFTLPVFKLMSDGTTLVCDTGKFKVIGKHASGLPLIGVVGDEEEWDGDAVET